MATKKNSVRERALKAGVPDSFLVHLQAVQGAAQAPPKDPRMVEWLAFVAAYPQYAHDCKLKNDFFKQSFMEDYHRFKTAKRYVKRALRELDA